MIQGVLTLILVEAESNSVQSASVLKRSASVSTAAVINLPMWNPALIKSGLLARVFATSRVHRGRLLG
jgi:hypothetical protein